MKTNTSCYLALTALATALTPLAFAQAPDPARAAAQNASAMASAAAAHATPPVLPSAAASGQAAAQQSAAANSAAAQGAANAAAHSPAVTGATSTGASATNAAGAPIPTTSGTTNAGMANSTDTSVDTSRDRVNAKVRTNGTTGAPGLHGTADGQVSASLNTAAMTSQIRNSSFETRDTVYSQVDATLQTTHVAMAQLRQRGSQLSGTSRDQFKSAYEQLRLREQALRDSLRDARSASAATYADAQAKLASDYEAYAQAVAAAEAAGAVNPKP